MATMIAAITTTAVFSVVLSSFVSDTRADKRDAAAMAVRQAQEVLKNYVSVEPLNAAWSPLGNGQPGRWPADSSGVWALRQGMHDISDLLDNTVLAGGMGVACTLPDCSFTYQVVNSNCGFGNADELACKEVRFRLNYKD